ncbi:cyclase family protein [Deinococcus sp. YIM 77859]|uniref:cyclase family protein n=1 Tax=Deinococcus sp. YIM 77859 TaxID=1540221 RepID=UPI00350E4E9F
MWRYFRAAHRERDRFPLSSPHDRHFKAADPRTSHLAGDAPFRVEPLARIARGDSVNTGELRTSTHTGTHVDAPWHYDDAGRAWTK